MDDWQNLDNEDVQPPPKVVPIAAVNKWEGEDEDDEIKDSWDAEDEDEKKDEEKNAPAPSTKPKKTLQQKIAERQKLEEELEEKRRKEKESENLSPAEKLRLEKLRQEADTMTAMATLGLSSSDSDFNPSSVEEFKKFADTFCSRVNESKKKEELFPVLEEMIKNLCAGMSSTNIRKIKAGLDVLHTEKQKLEKGDKGKKKPSAKPGGKLRVERDNDYDFSKTGAYEADDYDDFM